MHLSARCLAPLSARQMLANFFSRECQRQGVRSAVIGPALLPPSSSASASARASTSTSPSTTTSSSRSPAPSPTLAPTRCLEQPVLSWTREQNPFVRHRKGTMEASASSWYCPPRQQKKLAQAMEFVRGEERYLPEGERMATRFWTLPQGPKSEETGSVFDTLEALEQGTTVPPLPTQREITRMMKRGPYKGRKVTFKGHKWERQAESRRKEREARIESMPERIADYIKTRAATRAANKPTLPF